MKQALPVALFAALILGCLGCGSGAPTYNTPPAKPLSKAEEDFLKQVEAIPMAARRKFIADNRLQVIGLSRGNKTFGERLNADLGKPPAK